MQQSTTCGSCSLVPPVLFLTREGGQKMLQPWRGRPKVAKKLSGLPRVRTPSSAMQGTSWMQAENKHGDLIVTMWVSRKESTKLCRPLTIPWAA